MLLWEFNATTDLTGGRAQAVMRVMGSGYKFRWSFTHPLLTSCCVAGFLTGCGLVPARGPGVGDPWTRSQNFVVTYCICGLSEVGRGQLCTMHNDTEGEEKSLRKGWLVWALYNRNLPLFTAWQIKVRWSKVWNQTWVSAWKFSPELILKYSGILQGAC